MYLNVDSRYNLAVLGILRMACRTPRSPRTSSAVKDRSGIVNKIEFATYPLPRCYKTNPIINILIGAADTGDTYASKGTVR